MVPEAYGGVEGHQCLPHAAAVVSYHHRWELFILWALNFFILFFALSSSSIMFSYLSSQYLLALDGIPILCDERIKPVVFGIFIKECSPVDLTTPVLLWKTTLSFKIKESKQKNKKKMRREKQGGEVHTSGSTELANVEVDVGEDVLQRFHEAPSKLCNNTNKVLNFKN